MSSEATDILSDVKGKMHKILEIYAELESDVNNRFREEYSKNDGKIDGLEDFYMLRNVIRKNNIGLKNAFTILSRMQNLKGFDISEEQIEDKMLAELLKD
jgi:hypothetical protein